MYKSKIVLIILMCVFFFKSVYGKEENYMCDLDGELATISVVDGTARFLIPEGSIELEIILDNEKLLFLHDGGNSQEETLYVFALNKETGIIKTGALILNYDEDDKGAINKGKCSTPYLKE